MCNKSLKKGLKHLVVTNVEINSEGTDDLSSVHHAFTRDGLAIRSAERIHSGPHLLTNQHLVRGRVRQMSDGEVKRALSEKRRRWHIKSARVGQTCGNKKQNTHLFAEAGA